MYPYESIWLLKSQLSFFPSPPLSHPFPAYFLITIYLTSDVGSIHRPRHIDSEVSGCRFPWRLPRSPELSGHDEKRVAKSVVRRARITSPVTSCITSNFSERSTRTRTFELNLRCARYAFIRISQLFILVLRLALSRIYTRALNNFLPLFRVILFNPI